MGRRDAREAAVEVELVTGRATVLGVGDRLDRGARGVGFVAEPAGEVEPLGRLRDTVGSAQRAQLSEALQPDLEVFLVVQGHARTVLHITRMVEADAAVADVYG